MSSKRLKGLDEFSRKLLEEIIFPFMPIQSSIRSKTLVLTNETLKAISDVEIAVQHAQKLNLQLPKSTWMILKYSKAIQDIFNNLESYVQYANVKERYRKGVRYHKVLTWDKRSIESLLKKTPKPKLKNKDTIKIFRDFVKDLQDFTDFTHSQKILNLYHPLFIEPNSSYTIKLDKLQYHLSNYFEQAQNIENEQRAILQLEEELNQYIKLFSVHNSKINLIEDQFFVKNSAGLNIKLKQDERSKMLEHEPLSSYIKFLREIFESFNHYAEKLAIKIAFEEKGIISAFQESLINPSTLIDQHFSQFIQTLFNHAEPAFGKKHWFKKMVQEKGSPEELQRYMVSGSGFNAWSSARLLTKDIQELEQTSDFKNYRLEQEKLKNRKSQLETQIKSLEDKRLMKQQNLKETEQKRQEIKLKLVEWYQKL